MVSWLVVPLDSYKTPKFTDLETGIQYWDFPALSGIRYSFRIRYNFLYLFSMPKLCHLSNSVYLQWLSVLSFHLFKNSLAYLSTHFLYYVWYDILFFLFFWPFQKIEVSLYGLKSNCTFGPSHFQKHLQQNHLWSC